MKAATLAAIALIAAFNVMPAEAKNDNKKGRGAEQNANVAVDIRITTAERTVIHDYYAGRIAKGHCPPGLAKKNNGCMPPGQAKKWAKGRPLPRDVVFYDLPRELAVRITPPPAGYRYVRVASDILMIAIGSGMVIDAIEDLARL